LLGRKRVAAEGKDLVDDDILEPSCHAAASRQATRLASCMVRTGLSFWLRMSKSSVTMPHWGWLAERRSLAMVTVPPIVSPAITGFFHLRSVKPSPPQEATLERKLSTSMRRLRAPVCQPLEASPPSRLALAAASSR